MYRSGPITMTFPPFAGMVRKLILINVAVFFAILIGDWLASRALAPVVLLLQLHPVAVVHGAVWQLVTYAFLHFGILDILFAMMTLWFCGSILEGAYGGRWLAELYFTSVIGGAVLASAVSFTGLLHLSPQNFASGAWAAIFGLLIAIAVRFGDQEFWLWPLPFRIRAKYLVAIYILIALAMLLKDANEFGAALQLSGALFGYLYVKFAPVRGFKFGASEQYYGMRNAWYRAKRRRAAKKFEVYMGKQGRQVHFDKEGRYMDPDDARRRDPNDRSWMN